jgi:hypothetical protein
VTPRASTGQGIETLCPLKQSIYCMLAQPPTITSTYTIQTFSQMTEFPVSSAATDLYFEVYTTPKGIDTFEQITQSRFEQAQRRSART